jgi:hypothetical protein
MQNSLLVCPQGIKVAFGCKRQFPNLSPPPITARAFHLRPHHHLDLILRERGVAAYAAIIITTGHITTICGQGKINPGTVASGTGVWSMSVRDDNLPIACPS